MTNLIQQCAKFMRLWRKISLNNSFNEYFQNVEIYFVLNQNHEFVFFIHSLSINLAENSFALSSICRICFATCTLVLQFCICFASFVFVCNRICFTIVVFVLLVQIKVLMVSSHLRKSCQNVAKRGSIMKLCFQKKKRCPYLPLDNCFT